jgi:hypothetical protein
VHGPTFIKLAKVFWTRADGPSHPNAGGALSRLG